MKESDFLQIMRNMCIMTPRSFEENILRGGNYDNIEFQSTFLRNENRAVNFLAATDNW